MKRLPEHGFTLIELLVVICIISLLAAMLMPGLRRGYEMACRAVCANNVKQLAVGTIMYMNDNNDTAPVMPWGACYHIHGWFTLGGGPEQRVHNYAVKNLWSYYSEADFPSTKTPQTMPLFYCPSSGRTDLFRTCYSWPLCSLPDYRMTSSKALRLFSKYKASGAMGGAGAPALWCDRVTYFASNTGNDGGWAETNHLPNTPGEGGNVAHLDGSVIWFPNGKGSTQKPRKYYLTPWGSSLNSGHNGIPSSALGPMYSGTEKSFFSGANEVSKTMP